MRSRLLWFVLILFAAAACGTAPAPSPSNSSVSTPARATLLPPDRLERDACQVPSRIVASTAGWSSGRIIGSTNAATHNDPLTCTYGDGGTNALGIVTWTGPAAAQKPTSDRQHGNPPASQEPYIEQATVAGATDVFYYGSDVLHLNGVVMTKNGVTVEVSAPGLGLNRETLLALAALAADCWANTCR